MKLTNKSVKVIGIEGICVLPGGSVELTDEAAKSPVVGTYVRLGLVALEKGRAEFDAAVEAAARKLMEEKESAMGADGDAREVNGDATSAESDEKAGRRRKAKAE